MALTPEQVKKYRESYGFDAPAGSSTAVATPEAPEARIQRLKAAVESPSATTLPVGGQSLATGQNGPIAEPKKNIFGKIADFGIDVAKDAAKTLLVKPAARTAEAVGRTGILGPDIKKGYEIMSDEGGQNLTTPVGSYNIEAVKPGMSGAKQIAGEGLKSASYLYGGGGASTAVQSTLGRRAGTAILQGMKAGAVSGGAYGAGEALEQDKGYGEVAKEGLVGAGVGALAGGTVASVPAVIGGTKAVVKGVFGGAKRAVDAIDDAGVRSAEVATRAPAVQKAIKAGIDDNVVNFLETATPEDQGAFRKMFSLAERGGKDTRFSIQPGNQPKTVAGQTLLDRASHLIKVKDLGVAQSKKVLDSLDQSPVDVSSVLYTFLNDLKGKGITVVKRGNGYQFINQGAVPDGDLAAYQSMLKILQPDADGSVMRSYRGLHTGRQRIFNELNLAKARQQTFSDDVTRYADRFRTMLLDPIDKASGGKYKVAQQKTAESLGALREFVQLMGYKGDLEKLSTKDLKAAEIASRILGNASDRPNAAIQMLDDTARHYGYKSKGNVLDQIKFSDLLEDVFGTSQSRSLRGQVGRGTLDAVSEATGAAQEAATGNILALGSRALKAVIGKSKDDQILALKELLESLGRTRTNFGR